MSGLNFVRDYGGRRLEQYDPEDPFTPPPADPEEAREFNELRNLDYEVPQDQWRAINPEVPRTFRPRNWPERPIRFIDGKDIGYTVAWMRSPEGYPVPLRLSEIGSTVMRVIDRECRREFATVQRVLSMVASPFPWEEVESFAADLLEHNLRLLAATPPGGAPSYNFEEMRKAAQNKSNDEMNVLEELALAQCSEIPSVVDGRLEPRVGGFNPAESPVVGVIKKHAKDYLHPRGMQLLYELGVGQRTPVFSLKQRNLNVVSWYLRLAGGDGNTPDIGYVRVELPQKWFELRGGDWDFVNKLSKTIYEYRCRERSYERAPISLHPIVRAEESLGALFTPSAMLTSKFYRLIKL